MSKKISDAVVRRLPKYYHCLSELQNDGIKKISSVIISGLLNLTASQVRQDFSCFGELGQQGYGYDVDFLKGKIGEVLGLNRTYSMILIGAGNIGRALSGYKGFAKEGFIIEAVFDKREVEIENYEVQNISGLEEYIAAHGVDIAIIATDAQNAKECAARCVKSGVKAIWNFAQIDLYFGEDVAVQNISMTDNLMLLTFNMANYQRIQQQ